MRILFVSTDLVSGNIAYLLKREGHEVKIFVQNRDRRSNFAGLLEQTENWRKELDWVGKEGLIIFDGIGFGAVQDRLRARGYAVFGGSEMADRLEVDRAYAQKVFAQHGLKTVPFHSFKTIDAAIAFVKKNPKPWVIKQNAQASRSLNYVGELPDGRDVIATLEGYKTNAVEWAEPIDLQERIFGVEIGVARYFNGEDWVGPIEMNIEYKRFFPGNLGPATSEMGTLAWYDDDEKNKLFNETLAKLKPHLQKANFRGDVDINCIVNETGAYPLEATPRFGSPIVQLHTEFQRSPWAEFLRDVALGKPHPLRWKRGYGVVVLLAVPPFPYASKVRGVSSDGVDIYFREGVTDQDMGHVHFEEVSAKVTKDGTRFYVSDWSGYVLYVTGMGKTVALARKKAYDLVAKIVIPKMFYRDDIGLSFAERDEKLLRRWGYLRSR